MKARRRKLPLLIFVIASVALSGCGYFLYPERVGQDDGRVDPAVVVLDAAGLLFGIVPGVIAFAVDITTGAIYLPPEEESVIERHRNNLSPTSSFDVAIEPVEADQAGINSDTVAQQLSLHLGEGVQSSAIQYFQPAEPGEQLRMRPVESPVSSRQSPER